MRSAGFWVLLATILGSSLVFIDGAVVSIALPILQTQFHATGAQAQWVVEGYTLVLGALMLLCGALADRYGRKAIFLAGVGLFSLGSMGCGLAPTIHVLLIARIVQGMGGAMLAPSSLALLGAHFEGVERAKAIGVWSSFGALASAIGPVAGGVIIDHFGWRWVFGVNIPIAALIAVASLLELRESRSRDATGQLDVLGSALITLGLGAVVYAFIQAGIAGWSDARVIAAIVTGPLLLAAFLVVEARAPNPIMPLALFRNRTFSGVNLLTFALYGALAGLFYFLPFLLIRVDGYSATVVGFATLPLILLIVLLSRASGFLIERFGARTLLVAGPLMAGAGFACFAILHGSAYFTAVLPGIVAVGLGMGITVAPLTNTMMESVTESHVGLASGINNAVSRIAGLLAIAIFGLLLAAFFNARVSARMDAAQIGAGARAQVDAQRVKLTGATLADPRLEAIVLASYSDGFRAVSAGCAVLAVFGALSAGLLVRSKPTAA